MAKDKMTGLRKVAILFLALGPAMSSTVMRHFNDTEIEKISMEIANTTRVGKEELTAVLHEFLLLREAQRYILEGGVDYAREILEQIYGSQKAGELIRKLKDSSKVRPFLFMRNVDMKQLINLLNQEHPQTIALILSYLDADQAAMVLASMPEELQSDITRRVALMDRTSPDLLRGVEKVLKERLTTVGHQDFTAAGGIQTIVDILNNVDRGTEKHIMEELEKNDPELADEIRQLMFVFEDIISLDDNAVQRILRELDPKKLALAIKGTTEEVKNKLFRNMSRRAGEMLREDMEYMGPVRLREVEEAQQEIVGIIRRLDEAGEIVISRGGEDAIVF